MKLFITLQIMKFSLIFILAFSLLSCTKELTRSSMPIAANIPERPINIYETIHFERQGVINACGKKLVWWGDSMTEAPNEDGYLYSPLYFLAQYMKIDTFSYHQDGTGWHYNIGRGDSMIFMEGVSGQTSIQIKARFDAHPELWSGFTVIESGKNNAGNPDQVIADVTAMVAKLHHENYVVIGVLGSTWDYRGGPAAYEAVKNIDDRLKEIFGYHYLDPLPPLTALADLNSSDTLAIAGGVMPYSVTVDGVHLKLKGYAAIAKAVFDKLEKCN